MTSPLSRSSDSGIERDAERERDNLAAALEPLMSTLNFYTGPGARSAVSHESQMAYWRLSLALRRARGEKCPRCDDTGCDKHYAFGPLPCALRHEPGHLVPLPREVIVRMAELRDQDRYDDAHPNERDGIRVGPPRFEAELAEMGVE